MSARADRIRELLTNAIDQANDGQPGNFDQWREQTRVALSRAVGDGDELVRRFDDVQYGLSVWTDTTPDSAWDRAREAGVRRATEIVRAALTAFDLDNGPEDESPTVDVAGLHPWIAGNAASLWQGKQRRLAVEEAARSVEVQLRAKLGVDGGTGTKLVQAFAVTPPKPGEPRLRFEGFGEEGSEPFRNAHQGAMSFGQGVMMRIRNLYSHGHEPSDSEALEALAALSLLARWIDEAVVVQWSEPNA